MSTEGGSLHEVVTYEILDHIALKFASNQIQSDQAR